MTLERGCAEGFQLFNAGKFFEAHEALEIVWLRATGERKTFLHGLIQVAAAFHHHTRHNFAGCRSLLEKGCAKLEKFGAEFEDVDVAAFMLQLQAWRKHLRQPSCGSQPALPLPRIKLLIEPQQIAEKPGLPVIPTSRKRW